MLLVSASEAVKHAAPLHTCDEVWSVLLLTVEWEMSATEGERATVHPVNQGCVSACVHERERDTAPSPLLKIPTLPLRENLRNMVLMELRLLRSFIMSAWADSSGGGREVRWADMG